MRIFALMVLCFLLSFQNSYAQDTKIDPSVNCMAMAIYSETRAGSFDSMMAVATVVINRTEDSRFPHTICGVVLQGSHKSCQFQGLCGKNPIPVKVKSQWEQCIDISKHVIYFGERNDKIYRLHAFGFHNNTVHPPWAKRLHMIGFIGGHYFYSDYEPLKYKINLN